jgi:DMSO reductase anchor subunit
MKRTDSMPLKYHRDPSGAYKPMVDTKKGLKKHWNLARLSSRENPLVLFTLATQAALGAFALTFLGAVLDLPGLTQFAAGPLYSPLVLLCLLMSGFGLFMSTMHLGKPLRFYRGFNNLRHSPVCREGLGVAVFLGFLALHLLASLPQNSLVAAAASGMGVDLSAIAASGFLASVGLVTGYLAIAGGVVGLYYMMKCYRIKARPFWNHLQVHTAFAGSALALGALVAGVLAIPFLALSGFDYGSALGIAGAVLCAGVAIEGLGLIVHGRDMSAAEHEGAASHYIQRTTFGKTYLLRNALLGLSLVAALGLTLSGETGAWVLAGWAAVGLTIIATSLMGRALFYVLVVPTTMPGAFFWRNKGFEQHARDIGLANMPQVGVVPNTH